MNELIAVIKALVTLVLVFHLTVMMYNAGSLIRWISKTAKDDLFDFKVLLDHCKQTAVVRIAKGNELGYAALYVATLVSLIIWFGIPGAVGVFFGILLALVECKEAKPPIRDLVSVDYTTQSETAIVKLVLMPYIKTVNVTGHADDKVFEDIMRERGVHSACVVRDKYIHNTNNAMLLYLEPTMRPCIGLDYDGFELWFSSRLHELTAATILEWFINDGKLGVDSRAISSPVAKRMLINKR